MNRKPLRALIGKMKEKNVSVQELATKLEIGVQTAYRKLNGAVAFTVDEALATKELLGLDNLDVFTHEKNS